MITLQGETISGAWDELTKLLHHHNMEVGALSNSDFAPERAWYEMVERAGLIKLHTMRYDGELVGYSCMFITPHNHYPQTKWARQDAIYVVPEWRGFAAVRFMKFVDAELKHMGVTHVVRQVTTKRDFSRTLERMGYEAKEINYLRSL